MTEERTVALGVEYDGRAFHGFQRQRHAASVQAALESALSKVANEPVRVVAAGRTDAGVHATQQVVSFRTTAQRSADGWQRGTSSLTPDALGIVWATTLPAPFHAPLRCRGAALRLSLQRCANAADHPSRPGDMDAHRPGRGGDASCRAMPARRARLLRVSRRRLPIEVALAAHHAHPGMAGKRPCRNRSPRQRLPAAHGAQSRRNPARSRRWPPARIGGRATAARPRPLARPTDRGPARPLPDRRRLSESGSATTAPSATRRHVVLGTGPADRQKSLRYLPTALKMRSPLGEETLTNEPSLH